MKAFYSDQFVLPLPEGHKFPMAKYAGLRERILAEDILRPDDLQEAPAASWDDLRLVHTAGYVDAVAAGALPTDVQRRIGFPWSPEMVERSRRSVGAGASSTTFWRSDRTPLSSAAAPQKTGNSSPRAMPAFMARRTSSRSNASPSR